MDEFEREEALRFLDQIYAASRSKLPMPRVTIRAFGYEIETVIPYGWVYGLHTNFNTMEVFKASMAAQYGNFSIFVVDWAVMVSGDKQIPLHSIVIHPVSIEMRNYV